MEKQYTGSYLRRNSDEAFIKYFSNKTWVEFRTKNPEYKGKRKPDAFNVKKNIEKYHSDPSYKNYIDQKREERLLKEKKFMDKLRKRNDPVKKVERMRKIQKIGCRNTSPASGKSQVKSGQIKVFQKAGTDASVKKFNEENKTPEERKNAMKFMYEVHQKNAEIKREKSKKEMYDSIKTNEFTLDEVYKASGFGKKTVRTFLKDESLYLYVKKINGNTKVWIKNTEESIALYKKHKRDWPVSKKLVDIRLKNKKERLIKKLKTIVSLMEDNKKYSSIELKDICSSVPSVGRIINSDEASNYLIREQTKKRAPIYFTKK